MIKRFRDKRTAALFQGLTLKGIGADVVWRAKAKLDLLDAAATLGFYDRRRAIVLRHRRAIAWGNMRFV